MASQSGEESFERQSEDNMAAPQPLTKRELRRARKAAQRAADDAAKQARHAAKVAQKAAKKGGGMVAPVASATAATPAEELEREKLAAAEVTTREVSVEPVSPAEKTVPAQPVEVAAPAETVSVPARNALENLPTTFPVEPEPVVAPEPVQAVPPMPEHVRVQGTQELYEAEAADAAGAAFVPMGAQTAFDQYSRYNEDPVIEPAPKRKKKKGGRIAVAILLVLACLIGAGFAGANMYLNSLNQNLAGDEQEAEEVKEVLKAAPVENKPFYMLLIGCDDREGVDGARADTTILARLDPKKNKVTLISIPRDTAIDIDGYGMQKFNAAYTYGGASGTIEAASKLCGVEISHYAEVHFESLIDIIDYIGGVDVDVPIGIDDVDAGGKVEAGMQHLDGEHAMIFARSRSYETGDFQRTTSQRLLIKAAVDKMLSMDPTEYPGLLMKISECMNTDFSVQELLGLAQAFIDEPELKMYSAMVPSSTADIDGVSYVVADEALLGEMMELVNKGKNPAKLEYEDNTVKSSKEAEKQGIETIVNYGEEATGGEYYDPYATGEGYYYEDDGYYDESGEEAVYDESGEEEEYVEYDDSGEDGGEYYEE